MIDQGRRLKTAEVSGWYDCGKVETVLSTNLHLLQHGGARPPRVGDGVEVIDPVFVADGATVEGSRIGPNVSIDAGAVVRGSAIRDAIVGRNAVLDGATVRHCVIGDDAEIRGESLYNMVAARDEIGEAP